MGSSSQPTADPVLDLLGRMESQISRMETVPPESAAARALEPRAMPPSDPPEIRALREELAQSEQRGTAQLALFTEALARLRSQIPELLEDAISSRFVEVEERFYSQIREIHQRTMDSFLQSTQSRVGTRVASLESTLAEQAQAMSELQENYIKTDRNVDRLLSGLDRLTAELMRLSSLAGAPIVTRRVAQLTTVQAAPSPLPHAMREPAEPRPIYAEAPSVGRRAALEEFVSEKPESESDLGRKISRPSSLFLPVVLFVALAGIGILAWQLYSSGAVHLPRRTATMNTAASATGTAAQMKTAADFASEKDYAKAEAIYRGVIKAEPENRTAIKELASVLFKQQRYEEAASILKLLPPGS